MDKQVIALLKYKIQQCIDNHELSLDEALEVNEITNKQIPKIPLGIKISIGEDNHFIDNCTCPTCKKVTKLPSIEDDYFYCQYCGQKLYLNGIKDLIEYIHCKLM